MKEREYVDMDLRKAGASEFADYYRRYMERRAKRFEVIAAEMKAAKDERLLKESGQLRLFEVE